MKRLSLISTSIIAALFAVQSASAQYDQGTPQTPSTAQLASSQGAQTTFGNGALSMATALDGGSYLEGVGAAAAGAGQYNLNSSMAAMYGEQARGMYIQNYRNAIDARFAIKRANDLYRSEKFAKERMTPELLSRVIQARLPDRLSALEYNPRTGALKWPSVLMGPEFSADRQAIEQAFAQRRGEDVGVTSIFYRQVSQHAQNMHEKMVSEIEKIPTGDSVAARKFLKSVDFEARHLPETAGLAINDR